MVRIQDSGGAFPAPRTKRLFYPNEPHLDTFPIQDWKRLIGKREIILDTVDTMPAYLVKPEILGLLDAEKHPTYCLILDLMWTTGARISEVLALTPSDFIDDGYIRHSFAIHLLLHGRPLKIVTQLLGHKWIESTEIYTNGLTADGGHFLDGMECHCEPEN